MRIANYLRPDCVALRQRADSLTGAVQQMVTLLNGDVYKRQMQVIGATTFAEYRKYIEKDSALERRFQPVKVAEPSLLDTIEVIKGIRVYYEKHHCVRVSDPIVTRIVKLSERYITDRFLPDKAIDPVSYTHLLQEFFSSLGFPRGGRLRSYSAGFAKTSA